MDTLGFIGLGQMGGRIAQHLIAAGHNIVAYDRRVEAIETLDGAIVAESVTAVGEAADVVFLSLPGPEAVGSVVDELQPTLDSGAVIIDLTTSTPEMTQSTAERFADESVSVLGAPVSGGTSGAADGTLTVIVGGKEGIVEACQPYFNAFATNIFHVGENPGHGHAMKLLNNYLSFTAMVATSEAIVLGQMIGMDPETMCDIFSVSTGRNSATQDKFPDAVSADSSVGFTLGLMEKDTRLLSAFADNNNIPLLVANVIQSQVGSARVAYGDDGDMTDIYAYVRKRMTGDEQL